MSITPIKPIFPDIVKTAYDKEGFCIMKRKGDLNTSVYLDKDEATAVFDALTIYLFSEDAS